MTVSCTSSPSASPLSCVTQVLPVSNTKRLYSDAPLLRTEDARAYADAIGILSKQLASTDVVGRLLLRDLVDCDLEVRRLRTMKAAVIERARRRAAAATECGYNNGKQDTFSAAINKWETEHPAWRANRFDIDDDEDETGDKTPGGEGGGEPVSNNIPSVEEPKKPKRRNKSKQEQQIDMADAFLESLDAYERLDQLLGRAIAMRKEALRLFEQHVDRARSLRDEVIDAECTDVVKDDEKEAK